MVNTRTIRDTVYDKCIANGFKTYDKWIVDRIISILATQL